ncbi:MAG: 4-hydroxy-tetrahydrodipicolinate reductase [Paludibacteraceae bacterium]|nr:4-hydroxy-tetrahydrodipicolinate reductase [Paludibacteraceae bacterium]
MRIALIGYGKMGHIIEDIALSRGHEVVCAIDKDNQQDWESDSFASADVAIEFTTPATAETNVRTAWRYGKPVVSGTTGWNAAALMEEGKQNGHVLVWKSNFSVGVNVMFDLNRILAEMLQNYPQYRPTITEIHHIHKLDKPSGTAKTLAEGITDVNKNAGEVSIDSIREGEVPGTHTVVWDSEEDTIKITHIAKGRRGFALGAVLEAEKIFKK